MREGSRANALLVELLLVILFFMLGASVLVQVFASSRHKSIQARVEACASASAPPSPSLRALAVPGSAPASSLSDASGTKPAVSSAA